MFRKVEDFISAWTKESESTYNLLKLIPQEKESVELFEDGYSIGGLARHIVWNAAETARAAGAEIEKIDFKDASIPMSELAEHYKNYSVAASEAAKTNCDDESLTKEIEAWAGFKYQLGQFLNLTIMHQTHHRGELCASMRVLGLPIVGVFGPSREEGAKYGLPKMRL